MRGNYGSKIPGVQKAGAFIHESKEELKRLVNPKVEKPKFERSHYDPKTGKQKSAKRITTEESEAAAKKELENIGQRRSKEHQEFNPFKKFHSRLKEIRFAVTLPNWDISERSPGSAVVHAPGSQRRQRRSKEWYERKANQRHLWEAAIGGLGLTGAGAILVSRKRALRLGHEIGQASRTIGSTGHPVNYGAGEGLRHAHGPFAVVDWVKKPRRLPSGEFKSKTRPIHFEANGEPKRKHNIGAGLAIAAAGIPLYRGAGKFARIGLRPRIDKALGKPLNYGKRVADYLEGSQHILNQGITGKVAGSILRNPKSPVIKKILSTVPHGKELGGAKGLKQTAVEHYSSFRHSPTAALDSWHQEAVDAYRAKKHPETGEKFTAKKLAARKKVADEMDVGRENLKAHMDLLKYQGYNEREAVREAAKEPLHNDYFRRLFAHKAGPAKRYLAQSAGLAALPAGAGAAIASTTRKNGSAAK
jgi:hypothetical protein